MGKRHKFQGRPQSGSKDRQRCGAKLHGKLACCRRWPVKGKKRCRLHGGLSTGAKTPEGQARVLAVLTEGRRRWIEQMKAEGKKFPWGRKAGNAWTTPGMRERENEAAIQRRKEARRAARKASDRQKAQMRSALRSLLGGME